jgi:hypothetical protein
MRGRVGVTQRVAPQARLPLMPIDKRERNAALREDPASLAERVTVRAPRQMAQVGQRPSQPIVVVGKQL